MGFFSVMTSVASVHVWVCSGCTFLLLLFFVTVGLIHVVPLCSWSVALVLFHLLCCLVADVVSYVL